MSWRDTDIWSQPGRSLHLTSPCSLKGHSHGHEWMTPIPFVQCQLALPFMRYSYKKIWPWKSKVNVIAKVKIIGYHWGLVLKRYIHFSFCADWMILSKDIANSIFDLENWRSRPRQSQTHWSHLEPGVKSMCLIFVLWQSDIFGWDRANVIFDLENLKIKVMTQIGQNLIRQSIGQCHQSCQKWKKSKKLLQSYHVKKSAAGGGSSVLMVPKKSHHRYTRVT